MQQSPAILDLCSRKTQSGKSHDYRDVIVLRSSVFKMFSFHAKTKLAFSNSSGLKSVFVTD